MDKLSQGINGKLEKVGNELNSKLDNIARDIQCLSERVDKVESRISQQESWAEEVTTAMCASLEEHKRLQQKITDVESRSRRGKKLTWFHNSWISF